MYATFMKFMMPYCIRELELNSEIYIFLNRRYKPLGFSYEQNNLKYEDYPISFEIKGLTPKVIEKAFVNKGLREECKHYWLYDDATHPAASKKNKDAYFERLKILSDLDLIVVHNHPLVPR